MTIENRLAALENRLQAAEDHLEIPNLICAYGPLADSCSVDAAERKQGSINTDLLQKYYARIAGERDVPVDAGYSI